MLLFNGMDGEWAARIATLRRDRVTLRVERQTRPQAADSDLWLLFAPVKRNATEWIVEKATELGVAKILPVLTERTNGGRLNADRLLAIATEAAEQCERLGVPTIAGAAKTFRDARGLAPAADAHGGHRTGGCAIAAPGARPGGVAGRAGGRLHGSGDRWIAGAARFVAVASLGPRVLRAETAVIAGLALLQAAGPG